MTKRDEAPTPTRVGSTEGLGPLPTWHSFSWNGKVAYYTADQMRTYAAQEAAAERERWRRLLTRCAQALEWYAEYLNEAPIWHCTGYEANTVNPLLADVREALGPNA